MLPLLAMNDGSCGPAETVPSGPTGASDEAFAIAEGTLIDDAYRIVAELGMGAMGTVFLAHDEALDRSVAIKFARPHLIDDAFRARFLAEARAMARVNHPNVLSVYSFGEHCGVPYIVMEYAEGGSLQRWLEANPGLPGTDVSFRILDDLCRGVAAIHAAHTIHQDIKPDNILLDEDLRPRVADLGLAVINRRGQPSSHEFVGTPAYMAPEVAFPRAIDPALRPRADVYAVACVAYQLLTGRTPFDGAGNMGMLLQHAVKPVVPPTALRPDLPPELDGVLLRALAKNPAQRTATVEDLRCELALVRRALRHRARSSSKPAVVDRAGPPSSVVLRDRGGDREGTRPAHVAVAGAWNSGDWEAFQRRSGR